MFEKIRFTDETGEEISFSVLEQTRINGIDYLLISDISDEGDDSDEECMAMIVKDVSQPEDPEAVYEPVEDEEELYSVQKIFNELLDDFDVV